MSDATCDECGSADRVGECDCGGVLCRACQDRPEHLVCGTDAALCDGCGREREECEDCPGCGAVLCPMCWEHLVHLDCGIDGGGP